MAAFVACSVYQARFLPGVLVPQPLSRRELVTSAAAAGAAGLLAAGGPASAAAPRPSSRGGAALILHNARVFTGVNDPRPVDAVAVGRNGEIIATGTGRTMRRHLGRDTEVIDAREGTVMSAVHDGHAHPALAGRASLLPSLDSEELTAEQLRHKLGGLLESSNDQEPDGWLVVGGWNPAGLLPRGTEPHHTILDALPTRRPIALIGNDGHNTWVNQRALDIAAITAATPAPPGGTIVKDPDGSPTGLLKDDAQPLVRRHIPEPDPAQVVAACARALADAAAFCWTAT